MKALICVLIMAAVTYIPRVLPITILKKEIRSNFIKSFLFYVPYAVLAALTFPSIIWATGSTVTAVIGTIAAIVLAYLECGLVIVAIGAILTVALAGIWF